MGHKVLKDSAGHLRQRAQVHTRRDGVAFKNAVHEVEAEAEMQTQFWKISQGKRKGAKNVSSESRVKSRPL